jgi:gas vesicle protein
MRFLIGLITGLLISSVAAQAFDPDWSRRELDRMQNWQQQQQQQFENLQQQQYRQQRSTPC